MYVWLSLKAIKIFLIKWVTDFWQQLSYLLNEASLSSDQQKLEYKVSAKAAI
jgi:hypothetical protein